MSSKAEFLPQTEWPQWPEYGLAEDLLPSLERWSAEGQRVALATLVSIDGSSPRPLGSEMAVSENGEVAGYVSGGCVEAAVADEAKNVFADGVARTLDYGAGSPVLDIQLSCGGRIRILLRLVRNLADYVADLRKARERREVLTVQSDLGSGEMHWGEGLVAAKDGFLARTHAPSLRLWLFGADPIALAVARLAPLLDVEVGLLRPNGPAEPPSGYGLAFYDRRALQTILQERRLDAWSAVYAMTHDADDDLQIMQFALASPAFCIGVLGARSKIAARLQRLRAVGIADSQLQRLQMPAGLPIGANGAGEIALSILAQVIAMRPSASALGKEA